MVKSFPTFFMVCLSIFSFGQVHLDKLKEATEIADKWENQLNKTEQLLVVLQDGNDISLANLLFLERREDGEWMSNLPLVKARIGKNGFAKIDAKVEGDGMSPSGLFALGHLYSYEDAIFTSMPHSIVDKDDKWIDDPESPDYNRPIRGATKARSFENLLLTSPVYKYCMVIEYNTSPVIKGKGSAIFFHLLNKDASPTLGCVAISEIEMLNILKLMKPGKSPHILMGNRLDLMGN